AGGLRRRVGPRAVRGAAVPGRRVASGAGPRRGPDPAGPGRTGLPAPRTSAQPKTRRCISQARSLIIQAGAFAEHTVRSVEHTVCADPSWTGDLYDYGHTPPTVTVT
ncbi:hypothetical protein ACWDA8_49690, partial [Streptomyces sp. NPDC001130]